MAHHDLSWSNAGLCVGSHRGRFGVCVGVFVVPVGLCVFRCSPHQAATLVVAPHLRTHTRAAALQRCLPHRPRRRRPVGMIGRRATTGIHRLPVVRMIDRTSAAAVLVVTTTPVVRPPPPRPLRATSATPAPSTIRAARHRTIVAVRLAAMRRGIDPDPGSENTEDTNKAAMQRESDSQGRDSPADDEAMRICSSCLRDSQTGAIYLFDSALRIRNSLDGLLALLSPCNARLRAQRSRSIATGI